MQSIRDKMLRLISMASYSKVKLIPEPPNHSSRLHKPELSENWEKMRQRKEFTRIEPLK